MSSRADSAPEWQRYVSSALALKESIYRNKQDTVFSDDPDREIIYIFDTNIFVFEADINDNRRLTADIDNLVGRGPRQAELARVLERLTANFLFSGRLPGQKDQKSYITIPHLEEALEVARSIARRFDSDGAGTPSPLAEKDVRDRVSSVLEGVGSTREKLRELGKLLPSTWLKALDAKAHFRRVVREAFVEPGSLVPLDKIAWGKAAGLITHSEVQPWFNALPDPSSERSLEHIRSDGITLATMTKLYLDDRASRGLNRERLYVLVTTDRAMAAAVKRRLPILRAQGIPNFIRTAGDFLPLLNLNTMSVALSQAPAGHELRRAFENVFASLTLAVDWIALMAREGSSGTHLVLERDPVKHLQKTWANISEYIALLNAPYVKDVAWMFEGLREYLTPENKVVAASLVEDSVLKVADHHLLIVLDSTLAGLKINKEEQASGPRRIHLQVLGDIFSPLIPDGDLDRYLNCVIEDGCLTAEVRLAVEQVTEKADVQLLAACLFIAGDQWSLASQAASRGLQALEAERHVSPYRFDARYLVAHCLRFSMRTDSELQRAEQLLNLNFQSYQAHEDTSGLAWRRRLRDEIEYGSLLVTAAVLQALTPTPAGHRHIGDEVGWFLFAGVDGHAYLVEGVKRLKSALDELEEAQPIGTRPKRSNHDAQFFSSLRRQATTNLVEAFIFERIAPGLQGDSETFAEDEIHELVSRLGKIIEAPGEAASLLLTHYIYYWRARALLATSRNERQDSVDSLNRYLGDVKRTHKLPLIDMIEFQFIEDQLLVHDRIDESSHDMRRT